MDLVSSEYGWSDEQVLNLAYVRVKQIGGVIRVRQHADAEQRHVYAQLFYDLIASTVSWEGRKPRLPDLFGGGKTRAPSSQFRTDLWWQVPRPVVTEQFRTDLWWLHNN